MVFRKDNCFIVFSFKIELQKGGLSTEKNTLDRIKIGVLLETKVYGLI